MLFNIDLLTPKSSAAFWIVGNSTLWVHENYIQKAFLNIISTIEYFFY